jgi:hypothetical protein
MTLDAGAQITLRWNYTYPAAGNFTAEAQIQGGPGGGTTSTGINVK